MGSAVGMTAHRRAVVLLVCLSVALIGLAGLAGASHAEVPSTTVWLCRPGLANNPCAPDLTTTVYDARGRVVRVEHPTVPSNPPIDCFYVYPTTSDEPGPQADFNITPELRSIALYQAARYESECRVFAPVYRQITIRGLGGGVTPEMRETAYQDVRSAWLDYLAHDNNGRGVVLIGHSQGAGVLRRLLREELDPKPDVRAHLVSAFLLGGNVTVARGSDRGGDFRNIPACRTAAQIGCVVAFSTFDQPVPSNSLFGRTSNPALEVLCTNPTSIQLLNGTGRADVVTPTAPFAPGTAIAAAIALLHQPPITATTTWVEYRRAYRAQCVNDHSAHVLHISPLGNSPLLDPSPDPTWGLHLVDANVALGNLLGLVHREAQRWVAFSR